MNVSASKENILKKIRKALSESTPLPFPSGEGHQSVFIPQEEDLELVFANAFTALQGKFVYCMDEKEMISQLAGLIRQLEWSRIYCRESVLKEFLVRQGIHGVMIGTGQSELRNCDASITTCEFLVARTGSLVLSSASESGRTTSVYAPVHICIAYTDQLVYDVKDGLKAMREKFGANLPSLITFASGPSRTADIEKTLVVGVHGPGEVYVFLVQRDAGDQTQNGKNKII
ncbi:LutC/YkgG family protein [Flavihumibacter petaseus]|uniref:LUD domain-containing protein n=1 Tax=Flavihumibacter petaseus NBRC 106054 TaxID=1220578 RepID=A0A0E9MWC3_9BACT|nr:lactate utilization protein [Flavihumibacter petaseus]GAO41818.1 hypothetical protein FPE01S_01_08320 [Flavihumibacter petaseus NBRC 106054]